MSPKRIQAFRHIIRAATYLPLCGVQHNGRYVAARIMWRTIRIVLPDMKTHRVTAT